MTAYKVGDVVRYAPKWCGPGEEKFIHVVLEVHEREEKTQYRIQTLNTDLFLPPTEEVDEEMIIKA